MKQTEHKLQEAVMEHAAKETIAERNGTEAITMAEAELPTCNIYDSRLYKTLHSQFLEIAVCPDIVIAAEEEDLHSPVHKALQCRKDADIAFRHYIPVLIPEIPDVTKKINRIRILGKPVQEAHKTTLPGHRIIYIQPQVNI
jgi:hypothetical protein